GLLLFAVAPVAASLLIHILPGMLLIGLGAGMAFNPVLLAGTDGVPEHESGLVSGVLNTAFMMGGSLGLAILASAADYRTSLLLAAGASEKAALLSGYHLAFFIGALCTAIAALLTLRVRETQNAAHSALH
ncbi:MAG TPA: MFS transporter, partial [Candidatus Paceibacterota bacterium]|nr:MFS transporter [Candidatus Paceibacterota bacterium]